MVPIWMNVADDITSINTKTLELPKWFKDWFHTCSTLCRKNLFVLRLWHSKNPKQERKHHEDTRTACLFGLFGLLAGAQSLAVSFWFRWQKIFLIFPWFWWVAAPKGIALDCGAQALKHLKLHSRLSQSLLSPSCWLLLAPKKKGIGTACWQHK